MFIPSWDTLEIAPTLRSEGRPQRPAMVISFEIREFSLCNLISGKDGNFSCDFGSKEENLHLGSMIPWNGRYRLSCHYSNCGSHYRSHMFSGIAVELNHPDEG
jgi:hypothetical protein